MDDGFERFALIGPDGYDLNDQEAERHRRRISAKATISSARVGPVAHMSKWSEQRTPKGTRIPIPKRSDFLSNLKKAATPEKSEKRGPKK